MPKTRSQKEALLATLGEMVAGKAVVFTEYRGLGVRELTELRAQLRKNGSRYTVTKNTLLRKALEVAGITVPGEVLDLQLGVASSATDEVEPNRIIVEFAKANELLKIHGAIVDGRYIDEAGVRQLAALPTRDVLYARVVGSISAPLSGLVNVLSGNLRGLVSVLKQYQAQQSV